MRLVCPVRFGGSLHKNTIQKVEKHDKKYLKGDNITKEDLDAICPDGELHSGAMVTPYADTGDKGCNAMNLILHSITHPDVEYKDSVSKSNSIAGKFDVILVNPPFKGTVDREAINSNLTVSVWTTNVTIWETTET